MPSLRRAIPFVEVHLSNVYAREPFRQHSYFSDLAIGVITGLGSEGYLLALEYLLSEISDRVRPSISSTACAAAFGQA
jgi:3-dehydroquinate dehydratase